MVAGGVVAEGGVTRRSLQLSNFRQRWTSFRTPVDSETRVKAEGWPDTTCSTSHSLDLSVEQVELPRVAGIKTVHLELQLLNKLTLL